MSDVVVDIDDFGRTLEQLLSRVNANVKERALPVVESALEVGEAAWKENANAVLSQSYSRGGWGKVKWTETYRSGKFKGQTKRQHWYGRTYQTGKYARSISHKMISGGGDPSGEIGSASLPGLAHLLEKGHARVGGGSVPAYKHIEPAAEKAFDHFEDAMGLAVEEAINDA